MPRLRLAPFRAHARFRVAVAELGVVRRLRTSPVKPSFPITILGHAGLYVAAAFIGWLIYGFALLLSWNGPDGFTSPLQQAATHLALPFMSFGYWLSPTMRPEFTVALALGLPIYVSLLLLVGSFRMTARIYSKLRGTVA